MNTDKAAMYIFGAMIILATFTVIYVLIFNETPPGNSDLLKILLGALIAKFGDVVSYFYGSSAGSAKKTELMNNK